MENIKEKAQDDQDFLYHYGSIRSMRPTQAYRDNYDQIFKRPSTNDWERHPVDADSPAIGGNKEN